jgi:hypothetical protein
MPQLSEDFLDDPHHWHKLAEEARSLATRETDDAAWKRLSWIAKEYERIAWKLEDRARPFCK